MFENGRVMSLMRTVKGLQKCSMKAGQSLFSLFAHSPAHATRGSRLRRSPHEYRPRDFAVHPARILEQERDCSQSSFSVIVLEVSRAKTSRISVTFRHPSN